MNVNWPYSLQELEKFLKKNSFKKVTKAHWSRGSYFDLNPQQIPHDLVIHTNDASSIQLEIILRNRFIMTHYDRHCLKKFYSRLDQKEISAVKNFNSNSVHGLSTHCFFELSGIFLGLFGILLFLWICFSQQFPQIIADHSVRMRTFELIVEGMGIPSFPDTNWIKRGYVDSIQGASVILAFMMTFALGLGAVVSLVFSHYFPIRSLPLPIMMTMWSLILFSSNMFLGGSLVDGGTWAFAPWCALPGYFFSVSLRRAFKVEKSVIKTICAIQGSFVLLIVVLTHFVLDVAFPQQIGSFFPRVSSGEALITIRDEVMWPHKFGRSMSDYYYNNVILSRYFLRPPLAESWNDKTVLYLGANQEVIEHFVNQNVLLFPINDNAAGWSVIEKGLPDKRLGQQLGPFGFELLVVDKESLPNNFWSRLELFNPWLLKRTGVIDGSTVESPYLKKYLKEFDNKFAIPQDKKLAIEKLMYAVQKENSKIEFRHELLSIGKVLLFSVGLFLLVLWFVNGLMSAFLGFYRGGTYRFVSLIVFGGCVYLFWPSHLFIEKRDQYQMWSQRRAHITSIYSEIEQISRDLPQWSHEIKNKLLVYQGDVEQLWVKEFFSELTEAIQSQNSKIISRALASLDRLCRSILALHDIYRHYEKSYYPPALLAWSQFQVNELTSLMKHSDQTVAYWALQVASVADQDFTEVWNGVVDQLGDPRINVRDKAVLAIEVTPQQTTLLSLKDHYIQSLYLESCDYVRLHCFETLLINRQVIMSHKE